MFMKSPIFTYLVLPIYLLTSSAYADVMQKTHPKKTNTKQTAAAVCAALLTVATTSAVVVTKLTQHNPVSGWATSSRLYRNKHALAVFLGRGLKKKFQREEMEVADDEIAIVEAYESFFDGLDAEKIIRETDSVTLSRSIFYTAREPNGNVKGYVVLPGLVSRFEVLPPHPETNERQFILRAIGNDSIIARGLMRDLARHMPEPADVDVDAAL
jgi:hypothetical protein